MATFHEEPLWRDREPPFSTRASRMKPACAMCDHIHSSGDTQTVGRFRPGGPVGFRGEFPDAPVRATRAEAERDVCESRARDGL